MQINPPALTRSFGQKLILIGALAFLLSIPAMMVNLLVYERSARAETVRNNIFSLTGGRQTISGPVIIVPAEIDTGRKTRDGDPIVEYKTFAYTPKALNIDTLVSASKKKRSIYTATTFDADVIMTGEFHPTSPLI